MRSDDHRKGTGRCWRASRLNRGSRACPAAKALHEKHSRRVRRNVKALVAGFAKNVSAHSDARFVVQTIGTAIRALFGVERDHNAHMVRVILRDIFGHGVNITQSAIPTLVRVQRCGLGRPPSTYARPTARPRWLCWW